MPALPPQPRVPEVSDQLVGQNRLRVVRWRAVGPANGLPLLFLTGVGANVGLLAPFLDQLWGREVITFDMPGIGQSTDSSRAYRLPAMADAAREIVAGFGHDRLDVMGVSWGGMLAQEFAYRHRARTGRLVLAATSAGMPMVPGRLSSLLKMMVPRRYTATDAMQEYLQDLYGGRTSGLEGYAARIAAPTARGYLHQLMAIAGWTSVRKLGRVRAETLILMGAEDRLVPPVNGRILKLLLHDARLEILDDAGHLFLLTHRDEAVSSIEAFLDAQPVNAHSGAGQMQPQLRPG